jgi:CRP-like cAMP-binding protein
LTLEALAELPLLSQLDAPSRAAIAAVTREFRIDAPAALFREGDESHSMIWLVDGRLRVWSSHDAPVEVGPGALFGAIALVNPGKRRFSVAAQLPSRLLELRRSEFEQLVKRAPSAALALTCAIIEDQAALFEEALSALSPESGR